MGTETSYLSYSHMEHGKSLVKFNNPLMGTETQFNNIVCLVVAVT